MVVPTRPSPTSAFPPGVALTRVTTKQRMRTYLIVIVVCLGLTFLITAPSSPPPRKEGTQAETAPSMTAENQNLRGSGGELEALTTTTDVDGGVDGRNVFLPPPENAVPGSSVVPDAANVEVRPYSSDRTGDGAAVGDDDDFDDDDDDDDLDGGGVEEDGDGVEQQVVPRSDAEGGSDSNDAGDIDTEEIDDDDDDDDDEGAGGGDEGVVDGDDDDDDDSLGDGDVDDDDDDDSQVGIEEVGEVEQV